MKMKPQVCMVTGNPGKWRVVADNMGDLLALEQVRLETPEIQSLDVAEIAGFSARWAARELGKPVLKTDVGYYFEALGGFPGPFVKWVLPMLTPEQILGMMGDTERRGVTVREALVYAEPDGFTDSIVMVREATVRPPGPQTGRPDATLMDKLVVEYGMLVAEMTPEAFLGEVSAAYREDYRALAARIVARQGV